MNWDLEILVQRVDEGRFQATIPIMPGVCTYGATQAEAIGRAQSVALHILADRIEHGEIGEIGSVMFHPEGG